MITVILKELKINAGHGIYSGESLAGNPCQVDLWVKYPESIPSIDSIGATVDYSNLVQIVQEKMAVATPLLETICQTILSAIHLKYPYIWEAEISILKLQAAIVGFEGKVGVSLHRSFHD
jgi:dihydroneopterin aldolase